MFWLEGENGEVPPTMGSFATDDDAAKKIADFAASIIQGSIDEASCPSHTVPVKTCSKCTEVQSVVSSCQTHRHKFSCLKKKKYLRIEKNEGHGRLDKKITDEELMVPLCRYSFPKNPSDETILLRPFPEDYDKKDLKAAEEDFKKIRKYLLRMTSGDDFEQSEQWKQFCQMDFSDFLFEVGMFENNQSSKDDVEKLQKAKARYLTALRCEVKKSGLLLLKRNPKDVFTNNFNKDLISLQQSNMDVQYITDEYAVCEYISNYCTKNEGGLSTLLKSINDEAIANGEGSLETIRQLAKALDRGREVSIQESIYRLLGLPMSKFSSVVKFINTNHPERRDGLLKADLDNLGT